MIRAKFISWKDKGYKVRFRDFLPRSFWKPLIEEGRHIRAEIVYE